MKNLLSYCGLVDERIRASEKDLLVKIYIIFIQLGDRLGTLGAVGFEFLA